MRHAFSPPVAEEGPPGATPSLSGPSTPKWTFSNQRVKTSMQLFYYRLGEGHLGALGPSASAPHE